ncbi:MAG: DUF998 domain-containing protein [Candidatus Aenigmarchaeota archaeon]|nr:DUF998 domain-containing protein [Candidatus Aenigmarchaeota archaeon]
MKYNLKKFLLICGILAPLLLACTDILAGTLYPGYSFISQAISELFAIGAPTSGLVVPLFSLYSVLLIAFALGVWMSAGRKRSLRVVALMVFGNAANGLVLWPFFPMHMRGAVMTFTDTMHITLASIGVIFSVVALVFGAMAFRKRFRIYTIVTILILLVFGTIPFLEAPQLAANQPTPWTGFGERVASYVYEIWVVVLAIVLLKTKEFQAHR